MVAADFARWLKRALSYFDRKEPSDDTVNLWFEEVKDLPAEALPYAYQALTELDSFPRNLPGFLRAKTREWLGSRPRRNQGDCGCHSGAWEVAFFRRELQEWAIFRIPCGICRDTSGPRQRFDLLNPKLYDREPDRYQETPPPWAVIYPERDSLQKKLSELHSFLEEKRKGGIGQNAINPEDGLIF